MSGGGRIGYDTPYLPGGRAFQAKLANYRSNDEPGCQHGWYDISQLCMILERFDGLIFIGDASLQPVYSGINILLRKDLQHGALQTWSFDNAQELSDCSCDNQFIRQPCQEKVITSSGQVTSNAIHRKASDTPYACSRTPHSFLKLETNSPRLPAHIIEQFNDLAPRRPPSFYKHIPIIVSLSPAASLSTTAQSAIATLRSILDLAKLTGRKTDVLFLGPSAPGHITLRHHKTNQELWNFHHTVADFARHNKVDVLGLWNLTVQASSWDGVSFGEGVAITQAMMVVNWLGRLATS